jgi:CO/xanthine dehydrogenase FAD-binding subunit
LRLAVFAGPWPGPVAVWRSFDGASYERIALAVAPAIVGTTLDEASIAKAAAVAQAAAKPISDMRGDADYRRHLVGVLVKRALAIALDRAQS